MTPSMMLGALLGLLAGGGIVLILVALSSPRPTRGAPRQGHLQQLCRQAGLARVRPASVVAACAAAALLVGVIALVITAVPVAAALAAVCAGALPIAVLRRRARSRAEALRRSWPDAVDSLLSAVRAGMSLPEALIELSRSGPESLREAFADFAADYRSTASFAVSVDRLQDRLADPVADRVLASLRIARDVGGTDLGIVLRTLSTLLREDARTRGEIAGRQSWTVSAARLAVAAPWITLAVLCTRPDAVRAYSTAVGGLVLLFSAFVTLLAYRAMLRIGRLPSETRLAP